MDLSKISTEDLMALRAGDLSKVSTEGLMLLRSSMAPQEVSQGETGLIPAAKASYERLKGEAALLGGKLGITTPQEAEAYQQEQEKKAQRIFKPTEEGWQEAPLTKFKELLGGSLPYMAAPLVAGAAVAATPLTGTAALAAGIGAAGLTSAAQFTGSNLARTMETGKSLEEASLGAAAAAAIPQAALDIVSFRATPIIRRLFSSVGKEITEDAAQNLAKQGFANTVKDYALTTGKTAGTEGLTEAGQAFFERLQAGLAIADTEARAEYLDNFIGGAVLGGTLAPVGRFVERQKQVEEPLAPGQRAGETLEQTATRLNAEIQGLTPEAPPVSPYLSGEALASMAASENGFGKLVQYEEQLKQEPKSEERDAAIANSREIRKRLVLEEEARKTPTGKPYPFAATPEAPQFKSGTDLIDLVRKSETPNDALVKLLEYRAELKNLPESAARDQQISYVGKLYNDIQEEAKSRGFPAPEPFVLRASDLAAAGISKTDPLFEQLRNKDLNNPDEAEQVVRLVEEAQKRADLTPELYDRLEGLLDNVDAHLSRLPGSGFYAQRTYPKPSGAGVSVAGKPEPTVPAGGVEPSGRVGVAGAPADLAQPVPREEVPRTPVAVVKPNYAEMTLEQLEAARDNADQINLQLDLNAIRKYFGEEAAKQYEAMNRRARNSWWDKNATEALERESSVFQGVNEETIDEYIRAANNFDTASPKDLGRSVALIAKNIDQPNFKDSPEFVTLRNALTFAKQQGWNESEVLNAMRGRAAEWAGADAKELFSSLFKSAPAAERKPSAPALPATQEQVVPPVPSVEPAFEPGLEVGESERIQELEAEVRKLEAERSQVVKLNPGPNLFTAVKGKLARSDVLDIGPDKHFRVLTNAQGRGTFVSELVNNSQLDVWLPPDMRPGSESYDVQESEEYIKERLRNRDHIPYAVKDQLRQLNLQISNIDEAIESEKQLEILIRQANQQFQVAAEERRAEEAELPATEGEARGVERAEEPAGRKSLARVAPQVSEKKFQELERRAKQPSKPAPAKEEPAEVKAIKAERAEKISQLEGVLKQILTKYGLGDVQLNLEEGMQDEGSYSGQLIKLALDLDNPVRTLRHEAIHALKELGFFTPAQWKVLTDRAKSEWVDKYLKNQSAVVDGKEVTRYDAYMDLYKGDEEKIIEEAIADAFGDFSKTKPPAGMMQAILKRMENLFKGIKQAFNKSGYQTAEDVFGKIEEGKLTKAERVVQQVDAKAKPSLRAPDTKEFKQFFRESKITDEQDEPLVVYHGTKTDLTEFDTDASEIRGTLTETDLLSPLGSHFSRDPQIANNFATKSGAVVYPAYLSIQNPKVYKKEQDLRDELIRQNVNDPMIDEILENPDNYLDYAETVLYQEETFESRINRYDTDPKYRETVNQAAYNYLRDTAEPEAVVDFVKNLADSWKASNPTVDGIIYENGAAKEVRGAKTATSYIAFNPGQIKSAIGNQGTYDITNADIRKSLRTLPTLPTDVTDRIKQTVIPRERPGMVDRLLDAISPRVFSKFRAEFVTRYDALAKTDRQVAEQIRLMGGVQQLADAKAESAANFSDLGGGLAASAMGVHDRVGGIPVYVRKYIVEKDFKKIGPDYTTRAAAEAAAKKVGGEVFEQGYTTISNANGVKGLIAIFSDLAKYKKPAENEPSVFDQYQFWADVKRASKYILNPSTGKYEEKLFTKDDIRRAAQIEKAFPEFVQIQKEWIQYNDGLVDFMRDTGVISEAGAKEMKKHGDYFPFYRHLGEDDIQGPRLFSSIANVKSVKAAKGSEAEVTDFFETVVRNTQSAIQSGIKNIAARRATDQALRIKEVFKLPKADSGPSVYRVLENGKETYYRAQDPYFIDALKALNQPDLPFIGLLAGPAKLLRTLVTKDPAFQLANMMRDSLSAYVSSGYKFTPIVATLKQYGSIIAGKSPEVEALRKAGVIGGYDYSQGVEASAEKLEKEMRKVAKAKTGLEKLTSPVTSLWGALEKSSEASDAATRNEVYKRVLADTGNEAEALYQALEVMNFNRKGRSPIIRILTAAVPFMNARIQGLDVLYRSGMRPIFGKDSTEQEKARLKTFWVRGMTMMALSAMYWALTNDDEEYKKQEQEVRDNYWLLPSLGIKIPIPFEIGVMFKVIPERILEYSMGSDTGQDFRKSMGRHLMSTFGFNPIPQTLLPAIEVTANYSFFTQRPIITQGMENISPEYQVGPNTSKIAGAIGHSLGISPTNLDYLIQGYTGTMGMYAVNLFDSIFSMNDEAPKPSRRLEQMPVLKRFMLDPEARGQITSYYDLKNSVDQVVRTSNFLERSMDFEQYGKYMQENVRMFAARDYINDLEKTMKEFREMKQLIRISKMDADVKRDNLTNIGKMEQQLTQNIKTLKKQLAAQQ